MSTGRPLPNEELVGYTKAEVDTHAEGLNEPLHHARGQVRNERKERVGFVESECVLVTSEKQRS